MSKAKYSQIAIEALTEYKNNARTHSPEQVAKIARSIQEFGFINPVLINKDNVIMAGHGRVMAAKELGMTEVPCLRVEHLTEAQMRAYVLADNKLAEEAGWDLELLQSELQALQDLDFDISLTGFDSLEDVELELEKQKDYGEVKDDNFEPEVPEEAKAKPGEIYQLGRHRLMCGDSTKIDMVRQLMNGIKADLVVTDPPYNVAVENADGLTIANDNLGDKEFAEFLKNTYCCLSDSLRPGGAFYIWYASCETYNFYAAFKNTDLLPKQELVWRKNQFTLGRQDYQWAHEPCIYGWKSGDSHYFVESRREATVFDDFPTGYGTKTKEELVAWIKDYFEKRDSGTMIYAAKPTKDDLHPTMKPLSLIGTLVNNSSEGGQVVLDLFGGSGSTLIACEQLGRRCYMMEYDPKFVDVIIDRWEQFTGKKAVKL